MSQILWKNLLLPDLLSDTASWQDENYKDKIDNLRFYPTDSQSIPIPDAKAFRSMSRAALLLAHLCEGAQDTLAKFLNKSPFSVGIYCAVENGPIDAPSTLKIIAQNKPDQFAEFYRKFRNPKMYLKQLPNLAPAQLGIFMGLQGPMDVFTHSTAASLQSLEQAEWDLKNKTVDAALVCTAHAFDDFMVVKRTRKMTTQCINEGAGALILTANGQFTDWSKKSYEDSKNYFGISNQIIQFLRGEQK